MKQSALKELIKETVREVLKEGYYSQTEKEFMQTIRDIGGNVAEELAKDPWDPKVQEIFNKLESYEQREIDVRELRRNSQHYVNKQRRRGY